MRPESLFPYFIPISNLKGIGPKLLPIIANHIGANVRDLVFTLPTGLILRPLVAPNDMVAGQVQTIRVKIDDYSPSPKGGPYRVTVSADGMQMRIVYFHAIKGMQIKHPVGCIRYISGRIEKFGALFQITHPDYMVDEDGFDEIPAFEAIYSATNGLSSKAIRKLIKKSLTTLNTLDEWIDLSLLNKYKWQSFNVSLIKTHNPKTVEDLSVNSIFRQRLAYDEALAYQLQMKQRLLHIKNMPATKIQQGNLSSIAQSNFPFKLTHAQQRCLNEIRSDLASGNRMNRLIQGDVGSGKTLVALLILIDIAESGQQGVMMAPTEILARQHFETAIPILNELGITALLLTGRDKGLLRESKRAQCADGTAQIIFGTHALFQQGVEFGSLKLAVVDEQHRFGVDQRQKLFQKGSMVHYLSMSATPIPRSLALAQYGDTDISLIDEKPPGRLTITTAILPRARLSDVYERLVVAISKGSQVYWICPLVEETQDSDLIAVELRQKKLSEALELPIGLVHGKMPSLEKDKVISQFLGGEIKVLCATTVIEVGINVPQATIIVIEQAERFGLAQLHQLRGRVGRGEDKSTCILLYDSPLSQIAKARLELLRSTNDGFEIAEMDWKLRGEGDIIGSKQSGFPDFRFIDPMAHSEIMEIASKEASYIINRGDRMDSVRSNALKILIQLFERK